MQPWSAGARRTRTTRSWSRSELGRDPPLDVGYVCIVRTDKRLERARHRIENVRDEIAQYYCDFY